MANCIDIQIEASDTDLGPHDERWLEQLDALHADLEQAAGSLTLKRTPVEGHKSGISEVILALGSAGAITAAVQCFALWLRQGRTRRIKLTLKQGDSPVEIEVDGEGMSAGAVERTLGEALELARQDPQ